MKEYICIEYKREERERGEKRGERKRKRKKVHNHIFTFKISRKKRHLPLSNH